MSRRFLFLLPVLALLTACSDKYPYPPQFVGENDIPIRALGVPPAKYSEEYNAEIDSIILRQSKLTDAQKQVIADENHITPTRIVQEVLGTKYTPEAYPKLYTLLKRAGSDAWRTSDAHEDYWNAPRPWYADDRVALLVPAIHQPGYPSGHTTTNSVWAYILSDLFPAKRDALFERAYRFGYHRIDGGAHFPHDVEGGKRLAALLYGQMKQNPEFQRELADVRAELKHPGSTKLKQQKITGCHMPKPDAAMAMCH